MKALNFLVSGLFLCFAPFWFGLLGTVIGMTRAFDKIGHGGQSNPEALASDIGLAMSTTVIGFALCPVGLVLVIIAVVLLCRHVRERNQQREPT